MPRSGPEEVTLAKAKLDAVIAAVPLFETLSKRHLKKVAGLTTTVEHDAGDTVIQEGEPGDSFFITVSGQAINQTIDQSVKMKWVPEKEDEARK